MALLSEEQMMIRDMVRKLAQERIAPGAEERDREHSFPKEQIAAMAELGLLGMLVPEKWGGSEAGHLSFTLAMEEIAAADGACSTIMSVQNSPITTALNYYGNDEQKEKWLKPAAAGEAIGAFALTEPGTGSDASALRTRAVRDGNQWVVNGAKQFITSAKNGQFCILFAVTDPEAGNKGISAFLTPTDAEGFIVAKVEDKLGQHASDTCHVVFEDLRIPPENMLGAEGEGYRIALANLEGGRLGVSAQAIGMARAAYEAAKNYAAERETFGKPIYKHQAVGFRLADMATQIEVARHMLHHAATLRDAGLSCRKEASMAKLFATEMAEKVVSDALQIHGGYGYLSDYPVERIYRDVRVCSIYEGTSDIQRLVISREIMND